MAHGDGVRHSPAPVRTRTHGALAVAPSPSPEEGVGRRARPDLSVVGRPRRRLGPVGLTAGALLFLVAIALVTFQSMLVAGQQQLDDLGTELTAQTERYHEERRRVAELESPGRIVAAAEDLGMVPPPGVTYLTPSGSVTAVPDPGAAPGADYAAVKPHLEPSP